MVGTYLVFALATGLVMGIALVVVAALVYVTVTYSAWLVERKEAAVVPRRLGAAEIVRLNATAISEFWCAFVLFLLHPLGWVDPPPIKTREIQRGKRPILLVHGYLQTRSNFVLLGPRLLAAGLGPVYTINLRPWNAGLVPQARIVSDYIDEILRATRCRDIDVVAHSMGGLIARIADPPRPGVARRRRIRRLVTLGTPHGGTKLAHVTPGDAARDMLDGSPVLRALPTPAPGMIVAISSEHDAVILPPEHARIGPCGRDVIVSHVGHFSLLLDANVADEVLKALAEDIQTTADLLAPMLEEARAGAHVPARI